MTIRHVAALSLHSRCPEKAFCMRESIQENGQLCKKQSTSSKTSKSGQNILGLTNTIPSDFVCVCVCFLFKFCVAFQACPTHYFLQDFVIVCFPQGFWLFISLKACLVHMNLICVMFLDQLTLVAHPEKSPPLRRLRFVELGTSSVGNQGPSKPLVDE